MLGSFMISEGLDKLAITQKVKFINGLPTGPTLVGGH
jgi:hypothetical protein